MRVTLSAGVAIPIILLSLLAAGLFWYVLVRPVPEQTAVGRISGRSFQPREVSQRTVARSRVEQAPRTVTYELPDRYVYEIQFEDRDMTARFSQPAVQGSELEVGQRVRVVYYERRVPLVWRKLYIERLEPLESRER